MNKSILTLIFVWIAVTFSSGQTKSPNEFLPHITIGQDLTDAELFDVLERLRMEQVHFEETVTRMAVMYELENETWNVYETFRFRG